MKIRKFESMKTSTNPWSLLACLLAGVLLLSYRIGYTDSKKDLTVTTWDAFGYYMYLPSTLIYQDASQLKWLPEMDSTYNLTGGQLYQAQKHTNGNYVNKYLGGVAILQLPFFLTAHAIAYFGNYPMDGFSAPYQYAIAYGALIYVFLALLLLRKILLRYYSDHAVALSLLLLMLASNLIQYVSVDGAMSHAWIFPLYVLLLHYTIRWHEAPHWKFAAAIGLVIGLASISRPTEAVMLFIPLFWGTANKESAKEKWKLVRARKKDLWIAVLFGFLGILPQLIYWKMTAGSWIYDVGSSWRFLTPFFRVLFGFENGWFVYTPVALLFVAGFFFMRNQPFRKSVIVFCLLNIWIVISWADWKYGATYSTRALTQSYPVFMLAFGAIIHKALHSRWKWPLILAGAYLAFVNLFQIWQYNKVILHYRDMNRLYYAGIYLDPNPEPEDMSLLDTDENVWSYSIRGTNELNRLDTLHVIRNEGPFPDLILEAKVRKPGYVRVTMEIFPDKDFALSYIHAKIVDGDKVKEKVFRMKNGITLDGRWNRYVFFVEVPEDFKNADMLLFTTSLGHFQGTVRVAKIEAVEI
jgi:hypothetical protein